MTNQFMQFVTNYLVPLGILAAAIAYVISQWKSGGSKASTEVIATYREQVQQLKDELATQAKAHTEQMTALTAKVGELTGLITAKDTQINELKNLLLEKTPEMLEFYKMGNDYFREAKPILSEIKTHLQLHV